MTQLEKLGFSPNALNPVSFSMFLRSTGWIEDNQSRTDKVAFWTKQDLTTTEELDIIVPQSQQNRDYGKAIESCLHRLQEIENRSVIELYHSIANWSFDIIRVHANVNDINMPLDQGITYLDGGRDIIQSSACSVRKKMPFYPSRKGKEVTDFMQKVSLGHSEPGSFILKFLVPVAPKLISNQSSDLDDPFERQVSLQMTRSLSALKKAAIDTIASGKIESFRDAVSLGVSGNLCQSISRILQTTTDSVKINIEWSKSRAISGELKWNYEIDKSFMEVIDEAGREFKSSVQETDIEGMIVRLDRDSDPGQATTTKATIYSLIDGVPKQVNLTLNSADHVKALKAFQEGLPINCSGLLTKQGRTYTLENYFDFAICEIQ